MINFSLCWLVGYRYWRAKKSSAFASFITFFSVSGILLGVAALIIVSSVMNGFEGQLKQRILGAVPQLIVSSSKPISDVDQLTQALLNIDGVTDVVANASTQAMLQSADNIAAVALYGVKAQQVASFSQVVSHIYDGSFSSLQPGKFNLVLGNQLAAKLGVTIGDKLRVLSGEGLLYTPLGPVPSQRKFTVSGIFSMGSQVDESLVYINYQDARRLMRQNPDTVNHLRLYLQDPFMAPSLGEAVLNVAKEQGIAVNITDWRTEYGHLFHAVKTEKAMMALLLSLIIAVAAFNIVSALVMMVVDKSADVAVLKTQGMSSAQVMMIFIVQGGLNATIGLGLGLLLGLGITLNINGILDSIGIQIISGVNGMPIEIDLTQLSLITLGSFLIIFLAILYPAKRAAQVEPALVLKNE